MDNNNFDPDAYLAANGIQAQEAQNVPAKVTQYGYADDPTPDSLTQAKKGILDSTLQPGAIALTDSMKDKLNANPGDVIEVQDGQGNSHYGYYTDRAPEKDDRVDFYKPGGFDKTFPDSATHVKNLGGGSAKWSGDNLTAQGANNLAKYVAPKQAFELNPGPNPTPLAPVGSQQEIATQFDNSPSNNSFDPDAYLQANANPNVNQNEFDPDAYLQANQDPYQAKVQAAANDKTYDPFQDYAKYDTSKIDVNPLHYGSTGPGDMAKLTDNPDWNNAVSQFQQAQQGQQFAQDVIKARQQMNAKNAPATTLGKIGEVAENIGIGALDLLPHPEDWKISNIPSTNWNAGGIAHAASGITSGTSAILQGVPSLAIEGLHAAGFLDNSNPVYQEALLRNAAIASGFNQAWGLPGQDQGIMFQNAKLALAQAGIAFTNLIHGGPQSDESIERQLKIAAPLIRAKQQTDQQFQQLAAQNKPNSQLNPEEQKKFQTIQGQEEGMAAPENLAFMAAAPILKGVGAGAEYLSRPFFDEEGSFGGIGTAAKAAATNPSIAPIVNAAKQAVQDGKTTAGLAVESAGKMINTLGNAVGSKIGSGIIGGVTGAALGHNPMWALLGAGIGEHYAGGMIGQLGRGIGSIGESVADVGKGLQGLEVPNNAELFQLPQEKSVISKVGSSIYDSLSPETWHSMGAGALFSLPNVLTANDPQEAADDIGNGLAFGMLGSLASKNYSAGLRRFGSEQFAEMAPKNYGAQVNVAGKPMDLDALHEQAISTLNNNQKLAIQAMRAFLPDTQIYALNSNDMGTIAQAAGIPETAGVYDSPQITTQMQVNGKPQKVILINSDLASLNHEAGHFVWDNVDNTTRKDIQQAVANNVPVEDLQDAYEKYTLNLAKAYNFNTPISTKDVKFNGQNVEFSKDVDPYEKQAVQKALQYWDNNPHGLINEYIAEQFNDIANNKTAPIESLAGQAGGRSIGQMMSDAFSQVQQSFGGEGRTTALGFKVNPQVQDKLRGVMQKVAQNRLKQGPLEPLNPAEEAAPTQTAPKPNLNAPIEPPTGQSSGTTPAPQQNAAQPSPAEFWKVNARTYEDIHDAAVKIGVPKKQIQQGLANAAAEQETDPTAVMAHVTGTKGIKGERTSYNSASVPFMITKQMESDLLGKGYTQEAINKMKPAEAQQILQGVPLSQAPSIKSSEAPFGSPENPVKMPPQTPLAQAPPIDAQGAIQKGKENAAAQSSQAQGKQPGFNPVKNEIETAPSKPMPPPLEKPQIPVKVPNVKNLSFNDPSFKELAEDRYLTQTGVMTPEQKAGYDYKLAGRFYDAMRSANPSYHINMTKPDFQIYFGDEPDSPLFQAMDRAMNWKGDFSKASWNDFKKIFHDANKEFGIYPEQESEAYKEPVKKEAPIPPVEQEPQAPTAPKPLQNAPPIEPINTKSTEDPIQKTLNLINHAAQGGQNVFVFGDRQGNSARAYLSDKGIQIRLPGKEAPAQKFDTLEEAVQQLTKEGFNLQGSKIDKDFARQQLENQIVGVLKTAIGNGTKFFNFAHKDGRLADLKLMDNGKFLLSGTGKAVRFNSPETAVRWLHHRGFRYVEPKPIEPEQDLGNIRVQQGQGPKADIGEFKPNGTQVTPLHASDAIPVVGLRPATRRGIDRKTGEVNKSIPIEGVLTGRAIDRRNPEELVIANQAAKDAGNPFAFQQNLHDAEVAIAKGSELGATYQSAENEEAGSPTNQERNEARDAAEYNLAPRVGVQKTMTPYGFDVLDTHEPIFTPESAENAKQKAEAEWVKTQKKGGGMKGNSKYQAFKNPQEVAKAIDEVVLARMENRQVNGLTLSQAKVAQNLLDTAPKKRFLLKGYSQDKVIANAKNLPEALESNKGNLKDPELKQAYDFMRNKKDFAQTLKDRNENMAKDFRGDGGIFVDDQGQDINAGYRKGEPVIIPDWKIQVLNALEGGPSDTFYKEAQENAKTAGRKITNQPLEESTNPFYKKLVYLGDKLSIDRGGKKIIGVKNIISPAQESLRLDRIENTQEAPLQLPPSSYSQRAASFMPASVEGEEVRPEDINEHLANYLALQGQNRYNKGNEGTGIGTGAMGTNSQGQLEEANRSPLPTNTPGSSPKQFAERYVTWAAKQQGGKPNKIAPPDQYAQSIGNLIQPSFIEALRNTDQYLDGGAEHEVFLVPTNEKEYPDGKKIIKVTRPGKYGISDDLFSYLTRLQKLNELVPGLNIKVEGTLPSEKVGRSRGMGRYEEEVAPIVTSMNYIRGVHPDPVELHSYLLGLGYKDIGQYAYEHPKGVTIYDAHDGNFIMEPSGNMVPIDIDVEGDPKNLLKIPKKEPQKGGGSFMPADFTRRFVGSDEDLPAPLIGRNNSRDQGIAAATSYLNQQQNKTPQWKNRISEGIGALGGILNSALEKALKEPPKQKPSLEVPLKEPTKGEKEVQTARQARQLAENEPNLKTIFDEEGNKYAFPRGNYLDQMETESLVKKPADTTSKIAGEYEPTLKLVVQGRKLGQRLFTFTDPKAHMVRMHVGQIENQTPLGIKAPVTLSFGPRSHSLHEPKQGFDTINEAVDYLNRNGFSLNSTKLQKKIQKEGAPLDIIPKEFERYLQSSTAHTL